MESRQLLFSRQHHEQKKFEPQQIKKQETATNLLEYVLILLLIYQRFCEEYTRTGYTLKWIFFKIK